MAATTTDKRVPSAENGRSAGRPSTVSVAAGPPTAIAGPGGRAMSTVSPTYYKPAPAEVQYGPMRFLITDRPSDMTMTTFLDECNKHNVKAVVRVCEPSYDTKALVHAGIQVLVSHFLLMCTPVQDWEFPDGSPPSKEIRDNWLRLIRDTFGGAAPDSSPPCLAVHCVAGLGRAPVLVAIALIEAGVKYEDAVDMIRQ